MSNDLQQLKEFWKRHNLYMNSSQLAKFWEMFGDYPYHKTSAPWDDDDISWNFEIDSKGKNNEMSYAERYRMKSLIFIPLIIVLVILFLCHHYITKVRNSNSSRGPVVSRSPRTDSSTSINLVEPARTNSMASYTREVERINAASYGLNTNCIHETSPTRPIGFDVGISIERPIGFDVGRELEGNYGGVLHSQYVPRTDSTELQLPDEPPPPYESVVSGDLSEGTSKFPVVQLRDFKESPTPNYNSRGTDNR